MKSFFNFFAFLAFTNLHAQYNKIWYFGNNAGLDFNTSPPTILNNGQTNIPDNTSAISDNAGQLLFYTDGSTVWDKTHSVMPNGGGLLGNYTAGQCAVIIPVPCQANKYVIFYTTEFASPGYLHYSVVDMSLNGGFGDVITAQKNVSLGSGWTEKQCAYYNQSNNSYWLLVRKWNSDEFVAFVIDASSIAVQSVTSAIGSVHNCGSYSGAHDAMGQLTISPDGTKVLNALTCQDKFELFQFNSTTGVLSNSIVLQGYGGKAWGTAFSPNSNQIYTDDIFGSSIYQYNIGYYNQASIEASRATVATTTTPGYNFGYMELGPDNKIYIGRPSYNFLTVVNNPDLAGTSCNLVISGQSLGPKTSTHGTCRIAYNIKSPSMSLLNSGSIVICQGKSATLTALGANFYSWSNSVSGSVNIVSPTVTTVYNVTGNNLGGCPGQSAIMSVTVNVLEAPIINITGKTNICKGNSTILTASGGTSYLWNTNVTNPSIVVAPTSSTVYSVSGSVPSTSCSTTASTAVSVISCTGLKDQSAFSPAKIYSNPTGDEMTVELASSVGEEMELRVQDALGRTVLWQAITEPVTTVKTYFLGAGLYVVSLRSESSYQTFKIIGN